METKIREQAQRLIDLQKYKTLCETKIRQLSPGIPLPLTENSVKGMNQFLNAPKADNQENLKQQISELRMLLSNKDRVL